MKFPIYTLIFVALLSVFSCGNSGDNKTGAVDNQSDTTVTDSTQSPVLTLENPVFEFGKINQGEKVYHKFKYKNTGKSNLLINDVGATCGCTVPKWSKEPLAPGQEGEIEVVFDSYGKQGMQSKKINIFSNAKQQKIEAVLRGEVVLPEGK